MMAVTAWVMAAAAMVMAERRAEARVMEVAVMEETVARVTEETAKVAGGAQEAVATVVRMNCPVAATFRVLPASTSRGTRRPSL